MDASNPVSRQFQSMIDQSTRDYRQKLVSKLDDRRAAAGTSASPQWFTGPGLAAPSEDDKALSAALKRKATEPVKAYGNLRTLQPLKPQSAAPVSAAAAGSQKQPAAPMTAGGDPAILSLSKNNDLNVATIAREAQRAKQGGVGNEVVISLH
jgi:hypothetical protein